MRRRIAVTAAVVPLLVGGVGVAAAATPPDLRTGGPTSVEGTSGTAVFQIADRTIRQIRYADRGTLVYTFELANEGTLPVTVTGLGDTVEDPRLFDFVGLVDGEGATEFTLAPGETEEVHLHLRMTDCETLSARAGSIVSEVSLTTEGSLGLGAREMTVALPEEVRTGSPREAGCANATASSRPPG